MGRLVDGIIHHGFTVYHGNRSTLGSVATCASKITHTNMLKNEALITWGDIVHQLLTVAPNEVLRHEWQVYYYFQKPPRRESLTREQEPFGAVQSGLLEHHLAQAGTDSALNLLSAIVFASLEEEILAERVEHSDEKRRITMAIYQDLGMPTLIEYTGQAVEEVVAHLSEHPNHAKPMEWSRYLWQKGHLETVHGKLFVRTKDWQLADVLRVLNHCSQFICYSDIQDCEWRVHVEEPIFLLGVAPVPPGAYTITSRSLACLSVMSSLPFALKAECQRGPCIGLDLQIDTTGNQALVIDDPLLSSTLIRFNTLRASDKA